VAAVLFYRLNRGKFYRPDRVYGSYRDKSDGPDRAHRAHGSDRAPRASRTHRSYHGAYQ